jgi:hypothetical protein
MGATPQYLSLDDLFAPLPDYSMLGGTGPFVINLSSSSVPVSLPNNGIAVAPNTRVYQIRCVEDRSVRYRLRLGPFVSETQANAVLAVVRDKYPAALTATAISPDLDAFADIQYEAVSAEVAVSPPAPAAHAKPVQIHEAAVSFAPSPKPVPVAPAVSAAPIAAPPTVAPPVLTLSTVEYTPTLSATAQPAAEILAGGFSPLPEIFTLELLAEPEPAPAPERAAAPATAAPERAAVPVPERAAAPERAAVPAPAAAAPPRPKALLRRTLLESLTALGFPPTNTSKQVPVRLARGAPKAVPTLRNVPKAEHLAPAKPVVTAAAKPAVMPTAKPTAAAAPGKPAPASKPITAASAAVPAIPVAKAPAPPASASWPTADELNKRPVNLESTQTLRTLTPSELESATQLRWFVVELATSDRAFDPDTVPNLDIFSAYRLYSVESSNQGIVKHTLRLGFFGESIAAQAVADYLSSHYDKPAVARVSIAERERFSGRGIEARKIVDATGRHAAIEITDERYVREPRALT